jgi:transposase
MCCFLQNKIDMTYSARIVRNDIMLNMHRANFSQAAIGLFVNLTQAMVSKILAKHAESLPTTVKVPGYQRRLSAEQLAQLPKFLAQGAEFYEFTGAYWTHERVRYVINKEFNVDYEAKQAGRILDLIGWTWQKPQKKEAKQDLKKVEKWVNEDLPALKKKQSKRIM